MRDIFLISVLLSHLTFAQSWCPPEARWGYDMGHPWGYASVMQVSCGGDTIVDGHQAIKMMGTTITTQLMGFDTLITGTGLYSITREEEGIVFLWNSSSWDTLFWFSAHPGDRWIPPMAYSSQCDPPLEFHVVDTITVTMGDLELRQVEVYPFLEGEMLDGPVFIRERIGFMTGFFTYINSLCGVFECYCSFGCYSDEQMSYPGTGPCELTLGMDGEFPVTTFDLFPNPGHDSFNIQTAGTTPIQLCIRDPLGRLIIGPFIFRDNSSVDTSELPPGTYLIELQMPSASVMERWIKQ